MKKKTVTFPYIVNKNGRTGRVKKWKDKFATYFRYSGGPMRNTFSTFEKAVEYLDKAFRTIDTDRSNSVALAPLDGSVQNYRELEQLLKTNGDGATLREAVQFYIYQRPKSKFKPLTVEECAAKYIEMLKKLNKTPSHIETLEKHFRRFNQHFGLRNIHEIETEEIQSWIEECVNEKTGQLWSMKTRNNVLGSLVCLSLYSQKKLHAIHKTDEKNEFQEVERYDDDPKSEVDIYTPNEIRTLLNAAIEHDVELIPIVVLGAFLGLRPSEAHGEGILATRERLKWGDFVWHDSLLKVTGQKVRAIKPRDIPINEAAKKWLEPFCHLKGDIWRHKEANTKKLNSLRKKAGVRSVPNGFRHSYASYRIRELKSNLDQLAAEMGNSPKELISSYKRNVTDKSADEWFSVFPPPDYQERIQVALGSVCTFMH